MNGTTRLKVRLGNEEFEYEGPSENLREVYAEFLEKLKSQTSQLQPTEMAEPATPESSTEMGESGARKNGRSSRGRRSYPNPPMDTSIDLRGKDNKPSLRAFFAEKRPSGKFEANAVFGFYLIHMVGLLKFNEAQIRACYMEAGIPMPSYFRQSLIDTKNKAGYVEMVDEGWKLSIRGENFVKFDLPRKKEAKNE